MVDPDEAEGTEREAMARKLDRLASEAEQSVDEAQRAVREGDAAMVRRASEQARLQIQDPSRSSSEANLGPSRRRQPMWRTGLVAAAAAVMLLGWQFWSKDAPGEDPTNSERTYLTDDWILEPIGAVPNFEFFAIDPGFSDRFEVDYYVYDETGLRTLAQAKDQGPRWTPTKEQRAAMHEAGEILWVVRLNDPLGAPREGRARASLVR